MIDLLNKVILFVPVLIAFNATLAGVGAILDAVAKVQGQSESKIAKSIGDICAILKKVIDLATANLKH